MSSLLQADLTILRVNIFRRVVELLGESLLNLQRRLGLYISPVTRSLDLHDRD